MGCHGWRCLIHRGFLVSLPPSHREAMQTFKDRANREWTLDVNVGSIKRVKALMQIDLMQAVEGKLIEQLINDPVTLCNVIWALCQAQATQRGISEEVFGESMAGTAIDEATAALLKDLVDFFPLHRRQALAAAIQKQTTILSKGTEMILQRSKTPRSKREFWASSSASWTARLLAPDLHLRWHHRPGPRSLHPARARVDGRGPLQPAMGPHCHARCHAGRDQPQP